MFKTNESSIDRMLRVILGLAMLGAYVMGVAPDSGWRWLLLVGVVPLLTGLVGSCPLYSILGLSTCPMKKG